MYFTEISNNNIPAVDEQLLVTSLDLSLRLKAAGVRRYAHKMWACKKINPVQHILCNTPGTPARSFGVSYQERSALAYNSMELDAIVKGQGYVWMDDDETYVAFAHSDYKGAGIGIVGSGYISEAEAKGELALFILAREAKKKELERPPL